MQKTDNYDLSADGLCVSGLFTNHKLNRLIKDSISDVHREIERLRGVAKKDNAKHPANYGVLVMLSNLLISAIFIEAINRSDSYNDVYQKVCDQFLNKINEPFSSSAITFITSSNKPHRNTQFDDFKIMVSRANMTSVMMFNKSETRNNLLIDDFIWSVFNFLGEPRDIDSYKAEAINSRVEILICAFDKFVEFSTTKQTDSFESFESRKIQVTAMWTVMWETLFKHVIGHAYPNVSFAVYPENDVHDSDLSSKVLDEEKKLVLQRIFALKEKSKDDDDVNSYNCQFLIATYKALDSINF